MGLECLDRLFCLVAPVLPGGTSSYFMPLSCMHDFIAAEHSLSSTCFLIPNPAAFIRLIIFWYTLIISPSVLFLIGPAKM